MASLFTSRRERRLWIWAIVAVAAIYSTLGLASTLVGMVDQRLLAAMFLVCLILVGITILTQGLRTRPHGIEIGVGLGIALIYVMLGVRMAIPERSHLMEYSVVAVLVFEALTERASHGHRVRFAPIWAVAITSIAGALDEGIQAVLPSRHFDWMDILFNVLAAVVAVVGMVLLRWARRWAGMFRTKS